MRKLEPIITRFVDDVFRLVKDATADGLRALLAEESRRPPAHRPDEPVVAAPRPATGAPRRSNRSVRAPRGHVVPIGVVTANVPPPALGAEITDPQWLLAMGSPAPLAPLAVARVADVEPVPEPVSEGPVSTVREVGSVSPIRLRANETLARVSNAGVVIRRAR